MRSQSMKNESVLLFDPLGHKTQSVTERAEFIEESSWQEEDKIKMSVCMGLIFGTGHAFPCKKQLHRPWPRKALSNEAMSSCICLGIGMRICALNTAEARFMSHVKGSSTAMPGMA